MSQPPPLPSEQRRRNKRTLIIIIAVLASLAVISYIGISLAVRYVRTSGITKPLDEKFGDQHLKTIVALLELHKVRYGRYPQSLHDLRFTGEWDQIAVQATRYVVSSDGSKYYVEIERGWMGKPSLNYPPEFWQGTGYSADLKPHP